MSASLTLFFYTAVFIISISLFKVGIVNKEKRRTYIVFIFLSFFSLLFVNIFRASSVGTDYLSVGQNYTNIVNYGSTSSYEWFGFGLEILCVVIGKIFGSSPFVFYTFLGFVTMFFLYKFLLSDCCKYPTLSLFIFIAFCLYLQSFNQARQIAALSIVLYSGRHIKSKNFLKYLFTIMLASIFHVSSLIFIPLYFLKDIKINKRTCMLYFVLMIISYFSTSLIIKIISYTKYSIYFTTIYNRAYVSSTILNLFVRLFLLFFCYLFKEKSDDKYLNFCYHMIFICTFFQILTLRFYFLGRLTTYFYSFYIILLPSAYDNFLKKFDYKMKNILAIIFCLVMIVYFVVYYNSASGAVGSGYDMYKFIFM